MWSFIKKKIHRSTEMNFEKLLEKIIEKDNIKAVIISGIHGDEPAGNYIADHFKERPDVFVISNINPTGKRRYHGVDLNRHFDTEDISPIQKIILKTIKEKNPHIVIDLHEDDHRLDIYAYSSVDVKNEIQEALKSTKKHIPKYVQQDKTDRGVITHGKRPHKHTLERTLAKMGISYCLLETPTRKELKERVRDGILIVDAILKRI